MAHDIRRFTRTQLLAYLTSQQKWVEEHGGSKAAYVARYGSASDPQHYGNGGEAIYEADQAHLDALQARYEALVKRQGKR